MKRLSIAITAALLCFNYSTFAQGGAGSKGHKTSDQGRDAMLSAYSDLVDAYVNATSPDARQAALVDLGSIDAQMGPFLQYAQAFAGRNLLVNLVEQSRIDEQFGSGPNGGGSASAIAKAGITSLLSLAMENGAITQSLNGNTATVTGNTDAVLRFLAGGDPFPICPIRAVGSATNKNRESCGTPFLKNLGFGVSFDVNQPDTKTVSTDAVSNPAGTPGTLDLVTGKNRFSGASAKWVLLNPRDVRSSKFQQEWNQYFADNREKFHKPASDLGLAMAKALDPLFKAASYKAAQAEFVQKMGTAKDVSTVEKLLRAYLDKQIQNARTAAPDFDTDVANAMAAYMRYISSINPLLDAINKEPVLSVEYNFQRPQGQPDVSHFRIMSTLNPLGPNGTLTINAAGTLYNSSSVSTQFGRWRDAQASVQLERRFLGDNLASYPMRFSVAGYFQYMISPGLISFDSGNLAPGTNIQLPQAAAIALAPPGPIWIGEITATFKMKNSGVEIPFAITAASRTDLIKATSTRGHVGITYDLDKLFTNK